MTATINPREIRVEHSVRPDVGREFLKVSCPEGWDDVKRVKDEILTFEGRKFAFTGWNSDRNEAYFARPLNGEITFATIGK